MAKIRQRSELPTIRAELGIGAFAGWQIRSEQCVIIGQPQIMGVSVAGWITDCFGVLLVWD